MIRKYIGTGLVALGLMLSVAFAAPAFAQTDVASQIATLLAQIKALQVQIAQLSGQPASASAGTCVSLSYNLYADQTDATTNGEVTKLQQFLAQDSSIYPSRLVTGYFGPMTETAVQRWQATHGVVSSGSADTTGYGYVGPKTRTAIACGGQANQPPSIHTPPTTIYIPPSTNATDDRDAHRLSDIAQLQLALSLYYDKFGKFPIGIDVKGTMPPGVLGVLVTEKIISRIPTDPRTGLVYTYASGVGGSGYVLAAIMEDSTNVALSNDIDGVVPTGYGAVDCDDVGNNYCVSGVNTVATASTGTLRGYFDGKQLFIETSGLTEARALEQCMVYVNNPANVGRWIRCTWNDREIHESNYRPATQTPPAGVAVQIITPASGVTLAIGSNVVIQWTATNASPTMKAHLYIDQVAGCTSSLCPFSIPQASNLPASGSFQWTIKDVDLPKDSGTISLTPGSYRIRVFLFDTTGGVTEATVPIMLVPATAYY